VKSVQVSAALAGATLCASAAALFPGCGTEDAAPSPASDAAIGEARDASSAEVSTADVADGGPPELRILFVGDSYVFVNDLPGMLTRIASAALPRITTDEIVQGGAFLEDHWKNGIAQARIRAGGFTHVVLQGQSVEAVLPFFTTGFARYAQHFGDLIVAAGARPTFFVTWARAAGADVYDSTSAQYLVPDADQMQDAITTNYGNAARRWPTSILACVGEAFRQSLQRYPEISLHQDDKSHPTMAGTYLAAGTFYVALTGNAVPDRAEVPGGVGAEDAAHLRDVARIGTACRSAPAPGDPVDLYDLAANGYTPERDGADGGPPLDFGVAGVPVPNLFYLSTWGGDAGIEIRDAQVGGPFAWTNGAFPGGAGMSGAFGTMPFCSALLAPNSSCLLSVSYTASATGLGRLTLGLGGADRSSVTRTLRGTSTPRALLTVSQYPGVSSGSTTYSVGYPGIGETRPFTLFVANRGGSAATSVTVGTPLDGAFDWGPAGATAFPGGAGTADVRGITYTYCAGSLGPGEQCIITAHLAPTGPGPYTSAIDIAYADALGPIAAHARLSLQ
jgi:hypothetical protein